MMASTAAAHQVRYNVRWAKKRVPSSTSHSNISEATIYKKKVRAVLWMNRCLTQALVESRQKVSHLEKAKHRQKKVCNLALPQIKTWMELAIKHAQSMFKYQYRAFNLLLDITDPDMDFTLTRDTEDDIDDDEDIQDRKLSLHPPERRLSEKFAEFTVIQEEDEDANESASTLVDMLLLEQKSLQCAAGSATKVTPRKSSGSKSGGRVDVLSGSPVVAVHHPRRSRGSSLDRKSSLSDAGDDGCDLSADDSLKSTLCNTGRRRLKDFEAGLLNYTSLGILPHQRMAGRQGDKYGEKLAAGGFENCIPEGAGAARCQTSTPASTSTPDLNKAACSSSPLATEEPDLTKLPSDEPQPNGFECSAGPPVANVGQDLYCAGQNSSTPVSHHAAETLCRRSRPEPAEGPMDSCSFQAIASKARRRRKTGINLRLLSPSLTGASPEIPGVVAAKNVARESAEQYRLQEARASSQKSPGEPPTSAGSSGTEKENQASSGVAEGVEVASTSGLGCVKPVAPPVANSEALAAVATGRSRPTKTKSMKEKKSTRGTAASTSEMARARAAPSASGRPVRSASLGKNYKEPGARRKPCRP